jgi:putative spermidine/putrescine transport system substrate-binding protein
MPSTRIDRRALLAGMAGGTAMAISRARSAPPPSPPASPVSLNVIDVAGQLQLTQAAMEGFAKANPKLVSS